MALSVISAGKEGENQEYFMDELIKFKNATLRFLLREIQILRIMIGSNTFRYFPKCLE